MPGSKDDRGGMLRSQGRPAPAVASSAFTGFRFPTEIIVLAVRWYLRFGLSYRDLEALLAEHGIEVDHVTVFRWVQRFTREQPGFAGAHPVVSVEGLSRCRPSVVPRAVVKFHCDTDPHHDD